MNLPKISIIIPCYNVEKYLQQCMDSALEQTLKDIELICIDDGSTDNTAAMLDAFCAQDARVRVLHQTNQGVSAARNHGLEMAGGEYIAFMDPDDFYPDAGTLELLFSKASGNNAVICGGSFSNYDQSTGKVTRCYTGDFSKYSFPKEGFIRYADYQFDFGYHRFIYKRSLLSENNILFPPYSRFQDPPFFVKAMITAGKFYALTEVVYRYRVGIQDKPTSWPSVKVYDMMRGYLDVLNLSSEAGLGKLHALAVRRFEENDVYDPVMQLLKVNDETTMRLLLKINDAIDPTLLKQAGMLRSCKTGYVVRQLQQDGEAKKSRFSCFFSRIQSLLQCCWEQGFFYMVRLILEKLNIQ